MPAAGEQAREEGVPAQCAGQNRSADDNDHDHDHDGRHDEIAHGG